MRSIATMMVLVFVAVLLALGSVNVMAQSKGKAISTEAVAKCEQEFKSADGGNKGYLTKDEFHESMYAHAHKGLGPSGKADSVFLSVDTNKDGRLTREEFCAWKNS